MKTITLLFCSLILFTNAIGQDTSKKFPIVSFEELAKTTSDTVRLKAYVLDVYKCPPCPPGMICKPCMENHFTVVEEKPVDIMKIPLENRVRIFTDEPKDLVTGKQYTFTVRLRNKKTSPKDNLELISFK